MAETLSFEPVQVEREVDAISRPSLSYWQDAWIRLKANRRALISLYIVIALLAFTVLGPFVWTVDPAAPDLDQISTPPGADRSVTVVAEYAPWSGVTVAVPGVAALPADELAATRSLAVEGAAETRAVRLFWEPVAGAAAYRVYRNILDPEPDGALGLPIGDILDPAQVSFEDRLDLKPLTYYYSVVAMDAMARESAAYETVRIDVTRVITAPEALAKGLIADLGAVRPGDVLKLPAHPLGTDYLGRDLLARLMHGARVSLFIGIVAPFAFVILGIVYGSAAGFLGGRADQLLMRFADFVVALPFLLFMILLRILFGVQAGESGIFPMMVAMVLLSWPAAARLVRGQILQIREEGYIGASRLLGAKTNYLILRHMIPNTMGVILVTLTFAVPSAIFTEAFLSFIGMGVAPPIPSWGSMCNEGLKTMLTTPHELIAPAAFISITVLAFNLLGDGLRDALDARMRSAE